MQQTGRCLLCSAEGAGFHAGQRPKEYRRGAFLQEIQNQVVFEPACRTEHDGFYAGVRRAVPGSHSLLRGSDGTVWYKGLPGDSPNPALVRKYKGDFLKDLIRECHARGIRVIGGAYLDDAVVNKDPLRGRVGRDGKSVIDRYGRMLACFNHPDNQADNRAMLLRLVKDYDLDGLFLDDNFELDQNECFGAYCVSQFKKYCVKRDVAFADPSREESGPVRDAWVDCRRQATRALVRELAAAPATRKLPLGGWTGSTPRAELAGVLDLTGCMVYEVPACSVRLPVVAYGDSTRVVCLLWEPDTPPAAITVEGREAIRAGAPVVGFWIRGADGGYRIDDERAAAIREILYHAEEEWVRNYRETLITGDPRFEVVEGTVARDRISLTVRNAGERVRIRTPGPVDLGGVLVPAGKP